MSALSRLSIVHCPPRAQVPAPPTNHERLAALRVVRTHTDHLFNTIFATRTDARLASSEAPKADNYTPPAPAGLPNAGNQNEPDAYAADACADGPHSSLKAIQ